MAKYNLIIPKLVQIRPNKTKINSNKIIKSNNTKMSLNKSKKDFI